MAGDTRTERGDRRPTPDLADRRSNLPHGVSNTTLYGEKHHFFFFTKSNYKYEIKGPWPVCTRCGLYFKSSNFKTNYAL